MNDEISGLLINYSKWFNEEFSWEKIDDWYKITTPFLDRHNDYIQLYAKKFHKQYMITDDGQIINDLESSGLNLSSPKRKNILQTTLNGFNINLNKNKLEVLVPDQDFPLKLHDLIQAMLAVNDLFFLASPFVKSLFLEDVKNWLNKKNLKFDTNLKFLGKSKLNHSFDFVIQKTGKYNSKFIRTYNNPTRDSAESFSFAWIDTKGSRENNAKAYAFLNDTENDISPQIIDTLSSYEIQPVFWKTRNKINDFSYV